MNPSQLVSQSGRLIVRRAALRPTSTSACSSIFATASASSSRYSRSSYTVTAHQVSQLSARTFTSTCYNNLGLQPDTSDPKPPQNTSNSPSSHDSVAADIAASEYHEIADQYMDTLVLKLEEKAENPDAGFEVEYSAGVLTCVTPRGTYVLNKQPPNKQIWLSSPITGPKRFDWVLKTSTSSSGSSQDVKEGTESETHHMGDDGSVGGGKWIYLKDGDVLTELVKKELGVDLAGGEEDTDFTTGREGPGGSGVSE